MRVTGYLYLLVDGYPPFSLEHDPDDPVRFQIVYPEDGVARSRPLVAWLLVIPYLFVANIIQYLGHLMVFFGFFTILFTRKFPKGMFDIVVGVPALAGAGLRVPALDDHEVPAIRLGLRQPAKPAAGRMYGCGTHIPAYLLEFA